VRITVSPRALEKGGVELRDRRSGETRVVSLDTVAAEARAVLARA
jgi:hypothetical protein